MPCPAVKPGEMTAQKKVELFRKLVALDAPECPICMDIAQDGVISECGHGPFCRECMDTFLHNSVGLFLGIYKTWAGLVPEATSLSKM